jgi:hypothetical protein
MSRSVDCADGFRYKSATTQPLPELTILVVPSVLSSMPGIIALSLSCQDLMRSREPPV